MEAKVPPVRQPLTIKALQTHIAKNRIHSNEDGALVGRRCGDGRDTSRYIEAVFGADLGYLYAAAAVLKTYLDRNLELLDVQNVLEAVVGDDQVYLHTDNHDLNEQTLIAGCGFNRIARDLSNRPVFGLNEQDFRMVDQVLEEQVERGKVEKDVYQGDHNEGAVIVIEGEDGLRTNDLKGKKSVFVLQMTYVQRRLDQIADNLSKRYQIDKTILRQKIEKQLLTETEVVRQALASNLPIYDVCLTEQDGYTIIKRD